MNRGTTTKASSVRAASSLTQQVAANESSSSSNCCRYTHRDCTSTCVEGFDFCIRHILEDKSSPYRQCVYVTKAGRKCQSAAPKLDKKEGLCAFHTRKGLLQRQRLARKRRPKDTSDNILEELVATTSTIDSSNSSHNSSNHSMTNEHYRRGKMSNESVASKSLEYASSSDSDTEGLLLEQTWRDSADSDADSIDSDQEDILKYAGVYTTEEAAQILRDKLIRLQALYIDQFKRLKHVLLSKRKKYLQSRKSEKDLYGSIKRYKRDPAHKEMYEKLCAMKRYHKKFGVESLMHMQSTNLRMKITEGMEPQQETGAPSIQCSFVDEGLQCTIPVVPLSRFCQKHILHDQQQVLYQPCPFADSQCGRPVPTLLASPYCSLHQALPPDAPPLADFLDDEKVKKEEEKEEDNEAQVQAGNDVENETKVDVKPDPMALKLNSGGIIDTAVAGSGTQREEDNNSNSNRRKLDHHHGHRQLKSEEEDSGIPIHHQLDSIKEEIDDEQLLLGVGGNEILLVGGKSKSNKNVNEQLETAVVCVDDEDVDDDHGIR